MTFYSLVDVFFRLRSMFGGAVAIIMTFIISAGLHLFEMRVTLVLIGLAVVCVVESRLEIHLPHSVARIWFRLTAFVHLVFFGCVMMGQEEDETYFEFVMDRWLQLGFISLKILLIECILCAVLELKRLISSKWTR